MSSVTHEFVCYDPNFKGEFGDFTNNDVFTPEKRREYLSAYNDFLKKIYNLHHLLIVILDQLFVLYALN